MKLIDKDALIIEKARELLEDPKRFARGAWAKDAKGEPVIFFSDFDAANDPRACSFCYEGAVMKVCGDMGYDAVDARACIKTCDDAYVAEYKRQYGKRPENDEIVEINDDKGHKAVLSAMGRALKYLRRRFKEEQKKAAKAC